MHVGSCSKIDKDGFSREGKTRRIDFSVRLCQKLEHHVGQRYLDNISVIGIDPVLIVLIPGKNSDPECLLPVEAADLLSYLVLDTSYYTNSQLKAFRSLNAYNQMISGFITSVQGQIIANKNLVCAKVRHSQCMNDPPVPLWIITKEDGTVACAHCTRCMAGLGKCYSLVASSLCYLEVWTHLNEKPLHLGRIKTLAIEIYKALHSLNPSYISETFKENSTGKRQLRSRYNLTVRRYSAVCL